jgi:hypothetical protein
MLWCGSTRYGMRSICFISTRERHTLQLSSSQRHMSFTRWLNFQASACATGILIVDALRDVCTPVRTMVPFHTRVRISRIRDKPKNSNASHYRCQVPRPRASSNTASRAPAPAKRPSNTTGRANGGRCVCVQDTRQLTRTLCRSETLNAMGLPSAKPFGCPRQ